MVEFKVITYEKARSDFLKDGMKKAQNRMEFWQIKLKHAKNAIAEMESHDNASNAGWEYNFYKDALEALENQPKWISVEERLPEFERRVLVVDGHGKVFILAFWRKTENKWTWLDDSGHFKHYNNITHWMPLPEPPKEE